jgi:hypothetical protein
MMARHPVIYAPPQSAARDPLVDPTPLFEKEGDARGAALQSDIPHPIRVHEPGTRSRLAADDDPVNPFKVQIRQGAEEGLERKELDVRHGDPLEGSSSPYRQTEIVDVCCRDPGHNGWVPC